MHSLGIMVISFRPALCFVAFVSFFFLELCFLAVLSGATVTRSPFQHPSLDSTLGILASYSMKSECQCPIGVIF